jgi:4-diphosphocytidyl-2-C-methyl-D-erythritol kinase
MATARVLAQAKINLFLRVLAREASGFHQLETLLCRLDLGDDISIRLTESSRSLDCRGKVIPRAGLGHTEKNLAWRAATAFVEATQWATGFEIEIEKRIPVGGGLGGGSADAGAVLRALNALAPSPLDVHSLLRLGATLGADVPFLTQDDSPLALAWGRGDRLLTLPVLPARPCHLVTFRRGVATADAYRWLAESPAEAPGPVAYTARELSDWKWVELLARNEFERVVLPRQPLIRMVLEGLRLPDLRTAYPVVLMSGSGASIFALTNLDDFSARDLGLRVDPTVGEASSIDTLQTRTATHVEPVVVAD